MKATTTKATATSPRDSRNSQFQARKATNGLDHGGRQTGHQGISDSNESHSSPVAYTYVVADGDINFIFNCNIIITSPHRKTPNGTGEREIRPQL
jgi:hypothetical protein